MNNSEKFCLKWDDFRKNLVGSFADLREDKDFTDVTLACDDQQVEVHKVVLSLSSPFFQNIFKKNKNSHPLIYMRGLKAKELVLIVDFIYNGEVNINQEDLNNFLELAIELELKGLTGSSEEEPKEDVNEHNIMIEKSHQIGMKPTYLSNTMEEYPNQTAIANLKPNQKHAIVNYGVAEQIKSMMDNIGGLWTCSVCGLGNNNSGYIREHIETHLAGLSFPCEKCGKTFRSSQSFRVHTSRRCTK